MANTLRFYLSIISFCLSAFLSIAAFSQVRCATVEHTAALYTKFNKVQQPDAFEKWILQRKQLRQQLALTQRTQTEPYRIPVVIHVIHSGEPVGVGRNISDEQIISQINVLNKDFSRLNTDASQTPAVFQPLAGSLDIQFVLARQDPNGEPTTGILRKVGTKNAYSDDDDVALKAQSYWPSEDYLNIWVCNMPDLLGYAQFPISSLEGLEEYQQEIAITDGVVIAHDAFGSDDDGDFDLISGFTKGRTLTHEVGHFFGLRHIWGDNSSCTSTTDYVDDTPKQNNETRGCPSHPQTSCSNTKMFQNFMDYSNDPCMNLFTRGQVERMQIVLENSIRRKSLLSSLGLVSPPGNSQNIALRSILSPEPVSCFGATSLKIRFQNLGEDDLTYLQVSYTVDGGTTTTSDHVISPVTSLNYGELLLPLTLSEGEHILTVAVHSPNGAEDIIPENNTVSRKIVINAPTEELPTRERFETAYEERWTILNPFIGNRWEETSAYYTRSLSFTSANTQQTETTWLVSPVFNFTALTESNLRFDWSYRSGNTSASLQVKYTTDCGLTYQDLSGFSLSQTTQRLNPTSEEDWESMVINLQALLGFNQVRLAFVASSYLSNPIYLDNIELYKGPASIKLPIEKILAIYPQPGGGLNLAFNVEEKQNVVVSIFDMMGRTLNKEVEPNTLNQTKILELRGLQTGVYIVHIRLNDQYYTQKVFLPGQ